MVWSWSVSYIPANKFEINRTTDINEKDNFPSNNRHTCGKVGSLAECIIQCIATNRTHIEQLQARKNRCYGNKKFFNCVSSVGSQSPSVQQASFALARKSMASVATATVNLIKWFIIGLNQSDKFDNVLYIYDRDQL